MTDTTSIPTTDLDWLTATIARNKATYGGIVMELDESGANGSEESGATDETGDESNESGDESASEESGEGSDDEGDENAGDGDEKPAEGAESTDSKLDLDGAKKVLSKVRKEAASYREKNRLLMEQLEKATTPEQLEEIKRQAVADAAVEARNLLVENVALKHKLPEELADALKGETREELEKHAAVLAKFVPAEDDEDDPKLGGGLDATKKPEGEFDPRAVVKRVRASNHY